MTPTVLAPRPPAYARTGQRELLGAKQRPQAPAFESYQGTTQVPPEHLPLTVAAEPAASQAPAKAVASEIEKAVRRMPTLYVIAFFGVVVSCAVLIIWNTLQVNRLTAERTRLDDQIAQSEQRLIRLRAEEMQLSAPNRVNEIAHAKLGMIEAMSEDIVVIK